MIFVTTKTNTEMKLYTFCSVLLLLFLLSTEIDASDLVNESKWIHHNATNKLVSQTCKKSSLADPNINYTFCVGALQSSPSSRHADLTRLGRISFNLLRHNVTNTTYLIKGLLRNKCEDKKTKKGLKDCLELYSDSISTIREATRDYRAKRFDSANVKISSVMDASDTCDQGFQDVGVLSPLKKQNNYVFQLSAIALSIMSMVS